MKISDLIADFILNELSGSKEIIEIQRNDLANKFCCAPSQISYVIETRFKGTGNYIIESRRGGGGCITIRKVDMSKHLYLSHIISMINENTNYHQILNILNELTERKIITQREAKIIDCSLQNEFLYNNPTTNYTRCKLLKKYLLVISNDAN